MISGTPLQNDLIELWALLNFLMPDIFMNQSDFEELLDISDVQSMEGVNKILDGEDNLRLVKKIHMILKPFLLRRIKADV